MVQLPGIGRGIGAAIMEMVTAGRWSQLQRLQGKLQPEQLFQTLPGIGPELAATSTTRCTWIRSKPSSLRLTMVALRRSQASDSGVPPARTEAEKERAERLKKLSSHYQVAREFGRIASQRGGAFVAQRPMA